MTVRALIVDDEEPGRVNLRYALAAHPRWSVLRECASAGSALAALTLHEVDVVFLDIQMPRESGLDLARSLAAHERPPLIIFVTAHNQFAVDAFEVHALDYLLKPVGSQRLASALARAEAMLEQRQQGAYADALRAYAADTGGYLEHLTVRAVGSIERIELDEVNWIEACGNYVSLHLESRSVLHRSPVSRLAERLNPAHFMQVHRRAIVRTGQLAHLATARDGSHTLHLRCGAQVAVSERYVALVARQLGAS